MTLDLRKVGGVLFVPVRVNPPSRPPSAVELRSGARSRSKVFAVSGLDLETARARLLSATV
jgi:hypothetical protein